MFRYDIEIHSAHPNRPFKLKGDRLIGRIRTEINNCNFSQNFKTNEKKMILKSSQDDHFVITLLSKYPLSKPALSLRGLSRALVKTGDFDGYIYRGSLFNSRLVASIEEIPKELDDVEAAQEAVALFMSSLKEDAELKEQLRDLLYEHKKNRLR